MKILVFSDTHRKITNALSVIGREQPTHIFHLGDICADADDIKSAFFDIQMFKVKGNNDPFCRAPDELTLELNGESFFLTHGHKYNVKSGTEPLAKHAAALGVKYALFGHTHMPCDKMYGGVRMLNPSSSGYIIIENNRIEVRNY